MIEGLIKNAISVLNDIKNSYGDKIIKEYTIPTLCNMETCETTGIAVNLKVNNKFTYPNNLLDQWKEKFHADEYRVSIHRNQLTIKYYIHIIN